MSASVLSFKFADNKAEKIVRFRTPQGKDMTVTREIYLRPDIPCRSELCQKNCNHYSKSLLPNDVDHYILIDGSYALNFWEIFDFPDIKGIIVTLSTLNYVQNIGGKRSYTRIKSSLEDPAQCCVLFDNEFHENCFLHQDPAETQSAYTTRLNYLAACWYAEHLSSDVLILMITNNREAALGQEAALKRLRGNSINSSRILLLELDVYLRQYRADLISAHQLYESLAASVKIGTENIVTGAAVGSERGDLAGRDHTGYMPEDALVAGLKSGQFVKGVLRVNKYNAANEATVVLAEGSNVKDLTGMRGELLICGHQHRNRAIHEDQVCIEPLPKSQWVTKSTAIMAAETGATETSGQQAAVDQSSGQSVIPSGRVVGILQRNWRDYVCSLVDEGPAGSEGGNASTGLSRVLVTPYDRRIPRIRITTSQAAKLRTERFIVRIDSWDPESQYPNGHFVQALGRVGDLETETQTILIEHNLAVRPFTRAQLSELPVNTPDNPWSVEPMEVANRRDLRSTHLIFSIDPIGCQDVDDALSIRQLANGNMELGVHIADVTHFVHAGSLLDLEARRRSTSIYLADRRYDMLPHVLSGDLCSLWSGVDRYAVSVIWELSPTLEVLDVWFGRSIIRSRYKLYYELAQRIYDKKIESEEIIKEVPELTKLVAAGQNVSSDLEEMRTAIDHLVAVASAIKERRIKQGGLELEGVEVQVQFSDPERTKMEDLLPKQPLAMHDTIAECMIFANHWVAKRCLEDFPTQSCLRHHPPPRQDYFDELALCAKSRGFHLHTESNKTLAESLDTCVDPADPQVNLILRSLATQAMSNALYFSTGSLPREEFAHYGLALELYTHFTSPIRRYADILVHRVLLASLGVSSRDDLLANSDLAQVCRHMNDRHRQAQYAQRVGVELFQALFFRHRPKEDPVRVVEGVIYQLRANGFMVHLPRYGIRGPVYLKQLDGRVAWIENEKEGGGVVTWIANGQVERDSPLTSASTQTRPLSLAVIRPDYPSRRQTYRLFDHVTVRIDVAESAAHGLVLRLEFVSRQVSTPSAPTVAAIEVAQTEAEGSEQKWKEGRGAIFQSVRAANEERIRKRKHDESEGATAEDDNDDAEFSAIGRLHCSTSLYHFFRRVRVEQEESAP